MKLCGAGQRSGGPGGAPACTAIMCRGWSSGNLRRFARSVRFAPEEHQVEAVLRQARVGPGEAHEMSTDSPRLSGGNAQMPGQWPAGMGEGR
jgi:hypothetical protein